MSDNYIHKKGIVYKNQYHIIFCPKYKPKVLINDIAKDKSGSYDKVATASVGHVGNLTLEY